MADTLGANECPICRFDHLAIPVTVACPDHGHRLISTRGRLTCPGHRCRYWRPLPDDERKPGTVSDSQLTALAAQGVTGWVQALSYHEAGKLLIQRWRQAAAQMRQHLDPTGRKCEECGTIGGHSAFCSQHAEDVGES